MAIDYCLPDKCNEAEDNGNAALILFSYLDNKIKNIDFIENTFVSNKANIIINITENAQLQNNIFGLYLERISRREMHFLDGINYTLPNAGILLEDAYVIYILYMMN